MMTPMRIFAVIAILFSSATPVFADGASTTTRASSDVVGATVSREAASQVADQVTGAGRTATEPQATDIQTQAETAGSDATK